MITPTLSELKDRIFILFSKKEMYREWVDQNWRENVGMACYTSAAASNW